MKRGYRSYTNDEARALRPGQRVRVAFGGFGAQTASVVRVVDVPGDASGPRVTVRKLSRKSARWTQPTRVPVRELIRPAEPAGVR